MTYTMLQIFVYIKVFTVLATSFKLFASLQMGLLPTAIAMKIVWKTNDLIKKSCLEHLVKNNLCCS